MTQKPIPVPRRLLPLLLLNVLLAGMIGGVTVYAGSAYRAFSTGSYWNTPFEANAPIDPNSATYIADSENAANTQDYLKLTLGSFAEPIYFATGSDPLYTINAGGSIVKVHIPNGASPAAGSDGQMTIYDQASGYNHVIGLHGAAFGSGQWTADGADQYSLSSNGLESTAAGADDAGNFGHRGVSSATRAVRLDEIQAGAINHRLECFWWATAPSHYWPMVGHENNKGGIVPEGIVVRIKPSVNLSNKGLSSAAKVVATALQQYGCIVGDNSGSGNRLKLQENADWTGILDANSLQNIAWSDWEFVKGGAVPQGRAVTDPTPPPPPTQTPPSGGTTPAPGSPSGAGTTEPQSPGPSASQGGVATPNNTPSATNPTSGPSTVVQGLKDAPADLGSVVVNPSASLVSRLTAAGVLFAVTARLLVLGALCVGWLVSGRVRPLRPSRYPTVVTPSAGKPILGVKDYKFFHRQS